jgi:hypothetical protein
MSRIESPDMQLIELLRRSDAPSDEDMRRVRDAVGLKLAVGVGASAALLAATRSSWAMQLGFLGTWSKSLLLVSSLVGIGIGVTWYAKPEALLLTAPDVKEHSPRAALVTKPATAVSAVPAQESTKADSQFEQLLPAESGQKSRGGTAKSPAHPSSSTLEAEMAIVGRAQNALKSGQPGEALRALDEHARRFPSGVLALERSGVRTVALCQAGRVDEGRAAARSYLRLVPNSVLSKRIRIACQLSGE